MVVQGNFFHLILIFCSSRVFLNIGHSLLHFPTRYHRLDDRKYQLYEFSTSFDVDVKYPEANEAIRTDFNHTSIIPPGGRFRKALTGELSIVSYNILAPSYHWLGIEDDEGIRIENDRQNRVPSAIEIAKETNADIICLQEVEGGSQEPGLKKTLERTCINNSPGYDSYLWTPLNPNREKDIVGLCVAWRSDKHKLISSKCFRRGMVLQLEEVKSGATFCIGNVHLPARPGAIESRLTAMSTAIRQTESCKPLKKVSLLDGAVIMAGDFNCDQNSVTADLLKRGSIPYGSLMDRNYRAKLSKNVAFRMRHKYRFKDIYEKELRKVAAPITVSLQGRFSAAMDHIFYASHYQSQRLNNQKPKSYGKSKTRRQRATRRMEEAKEEDVPSPLRVESVLATITTEQEDRLRIVKEGLPNIEAGFPSDHIPIGVMFIPDPTWKETAENSKSNQEGYNSAGVSVYSRKQRESYLKSLVVIRRHNAILRTITEWLTKRGAKEIITDKPLYRWKWLKNEKRIKGKMRAPDLCCVLGTSLVIIEVTVGTKPDQMREQKLKKYKDLCGILSRASIVNSSNLTVLDTFVILLEENGNIPEATTRDLKKLMELSSSKPNGTSESDDLKTLCTRLNETFEDAFCDRLKETL